jgi:hypothetical protein
MDFTRGYFHQRDFVDHFDDTNSERETLVRFFAAAHGRVWLR